MPQIHTNPNHLCLKNHIPSHQDASLLAQSSRGTDANGPWVLAVFDKGQIGNVEDPERAGKHWKRSKKDVGKLWKTEISNKSAKALSKIFSIFDGSQI